MAIENVRRIAGAVREQPISRPDRLKRHPSVRPYTQFERGGLNRFRSGEIAFRPFRIA
ncbi:MAG: hypothetical protein WDO56_32735 [Gammaproteobacteria bacterium]